jgi:DNA-binding CsgD family transcriptional regulator
MATNQTWRDPKGEAYSGMKLLERELYIDALRSGLDSVSRGSGCITLVCGEAGIGKTSVLQEFVDRQREESAMRTALEIFERLGAAPLAGLARRKLRASGVRKIPRGAQERTRNNPHGLTNRELNVLALLAEGLRNAQIASRLFVAEKTIDHHVSAVLAKLNVRSRGEAAAVANQLGLRASVVRGRTPKR